MIDLHCHVLPGLDDGPPDLAASVRLASFSAQSGTRTIVATPHVREDYPFAPEVIPERVASLDAELADRGVDVRVVPGAELAISRVPELDDPTLHGLCLGDGRYVLVESPYTPVGDLLESQLFDLQLRGVQPVLAHPERSPCFLGDRDRLRRLVDKGILCSLTAASMAGSFGGTVRGFSVELLRSQLVHNVASDAHDVERRRPGLRRGFEALDPTLPGLLSQMAWFTEEVPRAILAGDALPPGPPRLGGRGRGLGRLIGRRRQARADATT